MPMNMMPPGEPPLPDHVLNPQPDFNERAFGRDNLLQLLSRVGQMPGQAMDAMGGMAAPYQDVAMGGMDPSGTYGMGGAQDFQPAPNPPMDPSVLEDIMAAGELAAQGMVEEAKQLYERAMWRVQRQMEKPRPQALMEGIEQGMEQGGGLGTMAGEAMNRGAGMAEDAYGAVKGLFK